MLAATNVVLSLALACLVVSPVLFTRRGFVDDWLNHLWLVGYQSGYIREHGVPTYFVSASDKLGELYPNFVFYGGSLYGFWGYISAVVGVETAFQVSIVVAVAWIINSLAMASRCIGLPWSLAFVPGILVVTSAYLTTILFGRGAWAELFALAGMTSLAAVFVVVMLRRQFDWKLAALVIVSSATWTGSHNITLMWGAIFLTVFAFVILLFMRLSRRSIPCLYVLILFAFSTSIGVLINAWFLIPDLMFAQRTLLGGGPVLGWVINDPLVALGNALALDRKTPFPDDTFLRTHYTQLPVMACAWIVLVLLWCFRRWRWTAWQLSAGGLVLALVFVVLVLFPTLWYRLPTILQNIQFTFRLESYVAIALGFSLIGSLSCVLHIRNSGARKVIVGLLLVIVAISTGQALHQSWSSTAWYSNASEPLVSDRGLVLQNASVVPATFYDPGSFRQRPTVDAPAMTGPPLIFATEPFGTVTHARSKLRSGSIARTNIASSPFLRLDGAVEVGQTQDGFAIVRVTSDRGRVTASGDGGHVLWLARFVSIFAIIVSVGFLVFLFFREREPPDASLAS